MTGPAAWDDVVTHAFRTTIDRAARGVATPDERQLMRTYAETLLGELSRLRLMVDEYGVGASALTDKLKLVRDRHRETCILADVPASAFSCGMCDILDTPAPTRRTL